MNIHAYFDREFIQSIAGKYLVLDTNVLTSLVSSPEFFSTFLKIFELNPFLLDPIVQLEFLRTTYLKDIYVDKLKFLELEKFNIMPNHQEIYKKILLNAKHIGQIQSKNGHLKTPLGDILIMARLMDCSEKHLFVTTDQSDFTTLLFDRLGIVSIEKFSNKKEGILEHISVLSFNKKKYKACFNDLRTKDMLIKEMLPQASTS